MGRVSRFMKAVSDKPKDAAASGAHQSGKPAEDADSLARVVASWPQLPPHIKQAILTLVEAAEKD